MAWADDRDGSLGYDTVTTLASAIDEAVPFVVVYMSDLSASFWAAMDTASDTDGKTIRVSTADGTTELACVPIGVNTSTDTGCLIFLGTGMSASVDVDYRIYVGNASLTMPAASAGEQLVFAAYAGVYFPGVDTRDWTSGGRTLTAVNSPGTAASAHEGITAASYTAASSMHHKHEGTACISSTPATVEVIFKPGSVTVSHGLMALGGAFTNMFQFFHQGNAASDPIEFNARGNGGSTIVPKKTGATSTSATYYAVGTRSGTTTGTGIAYLDGVAGTSESVALTAYSAAPTKTVIGATWYSSVGNYFQGDISVVLIDDTDHTADYVSTMQDNWAGTMYSAGAWTANDTGVVAGSTGWVLFQTAAQTTTADVDWIDTGNALIDDSTYAYCTVSDAPTTTEYLNLTNPAYGTTIPTGAPSYTVEFRVKGYRGNSSGGDRLYDETIQFIDDTSTRVGTNLAKTLEDWTTSATTREYTLAGYTPDGTEFTSSAGLAIRVTGADAVGTLDPRVVTGWIRVSWTGTDAAYNTRGFFALTE